MYHYQKVTVLKVKEDTGEDDFTPVIFISKENKEDSVAQRIALTERIIRTIGSDYLLPRNILIETPQPISVGDSFYVALSIYGNKNMFFVSNETLAVSDLNNLEETFERLSDVFLFNEDSFTYDFYFDRHVFYEVIENESKVFYSDDIYYVLKETTLKDLPSKRHEEPLIYPLGKDSVIFLTNEDIDQAKIRILELNKLGFLEEVLHEKEENLLSKMKERNYTLECFVDARSALKSVAEIEFHEIID